MKLTDAVIVSYESIFRQTANDNNSEKLANDKKRRINIPTYQRPYRWTQENIEKLFSDYADNGDSERYFIGSMVAVARNTDTKDTKILYDIVDGQQRLTTLFLINYVRFMIQRKIVELYIDLDYDIENRMLEISKLSATYDQLIGQKNKLEKIEAFTIVNREISNNESSKEEQREERKKKYREYLGIGEITETADATKNNIKKALVEFFKDEDLTLTYSRNHYSVLLKEALASVYLKKGENTSEYNLNFLGENDSNYVCALEVIYEQIKECVKSIDPVNNSVKDNNADVACLRTQYEYVSKMLENLSLCVILTEDEKDAYKLFEVLNDRALAVDDLELLKNHFYREYCTKSGDSDEDIDRNILLLDDKWNEEIFGGCCLAQKQLISYLATIYFTKSVTITYNSDTKFKDCIAESYSKKYSENWKEYSFKQIENDFNIYLAIRMLLDKCDFAYKKLENNILKSERKQKSVVYKAMNLFHLKYEGVMCALVNVILNFYFLKKETEKETVGKETVKYINLENYEKFIDELLDDKKNSNSDYKIIYKIANLLRNSVLKAKDATLPRNIAVQLIKYYGYGNESDIKMPTDTYDTEQNNEFQDWLNNWTFASPKKFAVKLLLLDLMSYQRDPDRDGYKEKTVRLWLPTSTIFSFKEDAELDLDHLEPDVVGGAPKGYFMGDKPEERSKFLNSSIGNFMLLDSSKNKKKSNDAMKKALIQDDYYKELRPCWLIEDIKSMVVDDAYFDKDGEVLKKDFFDVRSKHLVCYFKALLNKPYDANEFDVNLD